MARTQDEKACEVRDDVEKTMQEIVLNPHIYEDTYLETNKAQEQWKHIGPCVQELEIQQRLRKDGNSDLHPFRPLDTKIRVLVRLF